MRSSLRIALVGLVSFVLLSFILFNTHHDDWRDHLQDFKNYRPKYFQASEGNAAYDASKPGKPVGGGGIGDKLAADAHGGEQSAASDPGERPGTTTSSSDEALKAGLQSAAEEEGNDKHPEKAIVMAHLSKEDTSWVSELSDWTPFIYTVDDLSAPLHTSRNKGRESLAYLTYIIDYYDSLAHTIAFIHPHKDGYPGGWHTDAPSYSNVAALNMLQTAYIQTAGYANLRCNPAVGCPAELQLHRDPYDPTRTAEIAMADNWAALMGSAQPPPAIIATPCCAQFAVSAAQVRRRPRADYEHFRQWVLDTPLHDDVSGRVMEYLWHIMFGQEPVFCPDMGSCYCNVYGRC